MNTLKFTDRNYAARLEDWVATRKNLFCALLIFTLLGCVHSSNREMLPKERFQREQNNETQTYTLWETSVQALDLGIAHEVSRILIAYDSLKSKFANNVELIEHLNRRSQRVQDLGDENQQRLRKIEEKMAPGHTLYLFYLTEEKRNRFKEKRTASGKLILDRKGNLVWREIEGANYPFWDEEFSAERTK